MYNISIFVPNTNLKIIDYHWYSGRNTIGIVLCEDVTSKQTKAYIGLAQNVNEETDCILIAQWGTKIPQVVAESHFGELPDYAWT